MISLILCFFLSIQTIDSGALSPSFIRQEISDVEDNNKFATGNSKSINDYPLHMERASANSTISIQNVNYYSDGKTLTSIIWLSDFNAFPRYEKMYSLANKFDLRYGLYIDIASNNKKGFNPFDYDIYIQCECNREKQNWQLVYTELSSNASDIRTISVTNITKQIQQPNLFDNSVEDRKYIEIPVNLSKIGFPEYYKVLAYAKYTYNSIPEITIIDTTNYLTIPLPAISLTLSPSSVDLFQESEENINIQVNSSDPNNSLVHLSANSSDTDIITDFSRSDLNIPYYKTDGTSMKIKAKPDARIGNHYLSITANTSVAPDPTILAYADRTIIGNDTIEVKQESLSDQAILLVNVKPKLTPLEQVNSAWLEWGEAISGFNALIIAIVTGVSTFIIDRVRKKNNLKK